MKICILGKAPSWQEAPFDDDSIEIWTLNDCALINSISRFDRSFDMHIPTYCKTDRYYTNNEQYVEWLKNNQDKLWIADECLDFPNANIVDWRNLINKYGNYFTNSIAWMIAIALECHNVTDIYLCGVDLLQELEYQVQRPCAEYFIGIAKGRGINVYVQPSSTLLKSEKLYGIM